MYCIACGAQNSDQDKFCARCGKPLATGAAAQVAAAASAAAPTAPRLLDFHRAGPNKRVCAFFVDSIIAQVIGGLLSLLIRVDISWVVWVVVILLKDCVSGQSVGKYLIGTRVVDEQGNPAEPKNAILRNVFMIIPFFPLVEYLVMLRDKGEGRRIGDKVAHTKVNDLKPQLKDWIFLLASLALVVVSLVILFGIGMILVMEHPEVLKK